MNKLELTLVGMAQQQLSAVLRFNEKREAGTVGDYDQDDYMRNCGALSVLLELGHVSDNGMGEDAASAMLEIEAKYSAAVRAAHPLAKAAEAMNRDFPPNMVTGIQDIQALRTAYPDKKIAVDEAHAAPHFSADTIQTVKETITKN